MKRRKHLGFYFFIVAVVAALFLYRYTQPTHYGGSKEQTRVSKTYDHSIQTTYGQLIKVLRVIDGDTIELMNGDRLRYIGIDTPEEFDPRKPVQCFAEEAAKENRTLVEGKEIVFYRDISPRDKYGRWLGFVYLADGTFVNLALVQKGFAFAYSYRPDIAKSNQFEQAEKEAREKKRGLWARCSTHRLAGGREETNALEPGLGK